MSNEKSSPPAQDRATREQLPPQGGGLGASFISEDDLPEWLRAIAPGEAGDSESDLFQFGGGSGDEPVSVPSVTRAWSTSKDARGVDEATSLFALVASQAPQSALPSASGARPAQPGRPAAGRDARADESQGVVGNYGSNIPPGVEPRLPQMESVSREVPAQSEVTAKFPLLPVVVAGVLMLVLLLVVVAMLLS